jgi:diguanylate cyclase
MLDLDRFKQYNDKFGHIAGDIVLRTLGMILADLFKEPGMLVCRYGGEEFSVLLPDCTRQGALELAEEARKKIAEQTIILRREKTHITVSIGVAMFPQDAQNAKELIHKADQALYRAKEEGRNRVCMFA